MASREEYDRFLAEVRKETGIAAMTADESGLVTVRVDDAFNVNFQFVEATGKILCFVEVAELPKDASRDVYRDLLAGNLFGKDSAGGFFALEPDTETVVYHCFFDLGTAAQDVEEFVSAIEKILQLCELWAERLHGGDGLDAGASRDTPSRNDMVFHA
jgi:hypothetical protein